MKIILKKPADQYLLAKLQENFCVEEVEFDNCQQLNASQDIVVLDISNQEQIDIFQQQGFKIIVTKFYDEILDDAKGVYQQNNCLYLYVRDWFRIHSAATWMASQYNHLRPQHKPEKFFLMLMNLHRDHRSRLFEATKPYHHCSLYSYVEHGYFLPDDAALSTFKRGISDQHRYNANWYSQTAFSMVSEARVQWPTKSPTARFVTEKTFKPLAFQHALMVYGTPGTLKYLHELGFETFDHVIDESYDTITDSFQRLSAIESVLQQLFKEYQQGNSLFLDSVSQQKILHNYYAFFDKTKIDQLWTSQIINPIREFLHA